MNEPLRRTLRLQCPIEHAFEVFTAQIELWWPAGHRKMHGATLLLETHENGRFFERADNGEVSLLGDVLACTPPDSIRFTWHMGKITQPTLVDIRFQRDGAGTIVRLIHQEAGAEMGDVWGEKVVLFARGWGRVLEAYSAFAENCWRA